MIHSTVQFKATPVVTRVPSLHQVFTRGATTRGMTRPFRSRDTALTGVLVTPTGAKTIVRTSRRRSTRRVRPSSR